MSEIASSTEVLDFWFGRGSAEEQSNYSKKWFVSGESTLHEIDVTIYTKFGSLLEAALSGSMESWKEDAKSCVALIVVVDQFSRHIFRYQQLSLDDECRAQADNYALELSEYMYTRQEDWAYLLSISEHVFSLMPYRHTPNIDRLKYVLSRIEAHESDLQWNCTLLNRFRKQTTRRLQHLQDRQKAGGSTIREEEEGEGGNDDKYASILEREAFEADFSDVYDNPLFQQMQKFLKDRCADSPNTVLLSHDRCNTVVVSLSGGVDSMVIVKILVLLRDMLDPNLVVTNIIAIHIDYANRDESSLEADFVEQYCMEHDVMFRKRVVNEVTRGITDRGIYEAVSRDARYGFYKQVLSTEEHCNSVMFGHHKGDVQENVISNVMRGCSPLQLSGMTSVGTTNGVYVWRPLLDFDKDSIYDFAHKYGVPYFKDTTPSWSTRGKLRNMLVPLLKDMYGEGCLTNLTNVGKQSDILGDMVHTEIYRPLLDTVSTKKGGLFVNVKQYRMRNHSFWKEALKCLMHSMGMSMVRDKAVHIFMDRLRGIRGVNGYNSNNKQKNRKQQPPIEEKDGEEKGSVILPGWLELRKDFALELLEDGTLIIFREGALIEEKDILEPSISKSAPKVFTTIPISPFLQTPSIIETFRVTISHWVIAINQVSVMDSTSSSIVDMRNRCAQKVLQSSIDVLEGQFSYWLQAPMSCQHLEFMEARKAVTGGRSKVGKPPPALIGIDGRIRSGVPLLIPAVVPVTSNGNDNEENETDSGPKRVMFLELSYTLML